MINAILHFAGSVVAGTTVAAQLSHLIAFPA